MTPTDAVLAVTYRCNARCAMCGIWKQKAPADPDVAIFRKLPASLKDINLTGGEPYLRDDLPAIHAACREACPSAQTILSSNGLLTERVIAKTREMARLEPRIGVAISIDGPQPMHDRVRGVPGAYDKAIATIKGLQDAGVANLRIAFTASGLNVSHMGDTYELARQLGVQFTCAVEHTSEHYFQSTEPAQRLSLDELRAELTALMRTELRSFSPKRWARAYFMRGLYAFATGRGRLLPCLAGRTHFFMDPLADIYTCNGAPFRMGNLAQEDFATLWASKEADASRAKAARCHPGCWMICTARTPIKVAWRRVLAWAIRGKLLGVSLRDTP